MERKGGANWLSNFRRRGGGETRLQWAYFKCGSRAGLAVPVNGDDVWQLAG